VDKSFKLDLEDIDEYINNGSLNPILDFVLESLNYNKTGKNKDYLGNVDLLITNVPYGKVTEATEQFIEDGEAIYKNSLEANGLRECIDFLRPAKLKNGKIIEEGGIAIAVIPDSILENPSNKLIRDYLVSRCNILSIIGLPPYTFSPYAMEKTYAIIFQKIAPEQFDYNRVFDQPCFMYYSLCDGKANSQNRFRTDLIGSSKIKTNDGKETEVLEFIHNDFEPCYETFDPKKLLYRSKLEWAWNYNFASLNKDWDQLRITETWTGKSWKKFEGKKWGYFTISKFQREVERTVKSKSLQEKLKHFFSLKTEEEIEELIDTNYFSTFLENVEEWIDLTPTELNKIKDLSSIKYKRISEDDFEIELITTEIIDDVDINPDSSRYLGMNEERLDFNEIINHIKSTDVSSEDDIINLFRNEFHSKSLEPIKLMDRFDIIQGNSFSKRDAYLYPGNIPVYTAATDGPAYYVQDNIPKKVKVKGPSLIWSRKGAKAGTIQIFNSNSYFFISDVSGTIKPKFEQQEDNLNFLKYYIAGQVKRELQSKSNNAQLNKSKLENLKIFLPSNQDEIWTAIEEKLNNL
jgi:hypothetical protein